MMRDDSVYLADIIESIELINQYLKGVSKEDFDRNVLLQDAVYRRFEIIGEASSRISEGFKQKHPHVEWSKMKTMRNKIAHEYFGIVTAIVLQTVNEKFPPLLQKLQLIQSELDSLNSDSQ